MTLTTPVSDIRYIGPTYAKRLEKLNVLTAGDLVRHYPSRYEDLSQVSSIFSIQPGEVVTVSGTITKIKNDYTKYRKQIQRAKIEDDSGTIDVVWFNQPFIVQTLSVGTAVNLSGKVTQFGFRRSLQSPEYEIVSEKSPMHSFGPIHTGRIVPVYPETYGLSSKWLRSRIAYVLDRIVEEHDEYVPTQLCAQYSLLDLATALTQIHFPESKDIQLRARERLAFDELFLTQLSSRIRKRTWQKEVVGTQLQVSRYMPKVEKFIHRLPFTLTMAQKRSIDEILSDLGYSHPMNRLLQGDVGCGKTVVAAIAAYVAYLNGFTTVFMAPTEILAQQHHSSLTELFKPYGLDVQLVTSASKKRKSKATQAENSNSRPLIIVGTHALLFNEPIKELALVVIDEQHRFGVAQRTKLREMGIHPHLLSMTATPIPRSIALIVHSELDLSYIDQMPKGRKHVKTWLVPNKKRYKAYEWIKSQLTHQSDKQKNSQAFIICPLIEESEHDTMKSVKSAKAEYDRLQSNIFTTYNVGLLHGRLKSKEKQRLLNEFAKGAIDVLVSTPVVEVGIDIPNATVMLIEAAERFGLAQLHQLRGRVGRSTAQSYCLLFTESDSDTARTRLKSMESVHNGAKLSELDLAVRGPGDLYGIRQHGFATFKIARFSDHNLIQKAKKATTWIFENEPLFTDTTQSAYTGLQKALKPYIIQAVNPD